MVQSRSLVTNKIGYLLYSELRTDNPQHISHLEDEVRSCDKADTGSYDPGDTDPIISSDIETSEGHSRKVRLGDGYLPVHHPGIQLLPVLKVHRNLFSEGDPKRVHILLRSDDQKFVSFLENGIRPGNGHEPVAKYSGDHDGIAQILGGVPDCHAEDSRVLHLAVHAPGDILIVVLVVKDFLLLVQIDLEYGLEEHHQRNHEQDTQRIGHGIGRSQSGCGGSDI